LVDARAFAGWGQRGYEIIRKDMFNLEQSIAEWRRQMLAAGIKTPAVLEELEGHLREEIEGQIQTGKTQQQAFQNSTGEIGPAQPLKIEFKKIDAGNWNRPLAWTAWILFVISFFLPAYPDALGWRCAGVSVISWSDVEPSNWISIHLPLLSLANLLMMASPFLLPRFSRNTLILKWLRSSSFLAMALVWSFLLVFFTHGVGKDLKVGCYFWAASFLLLSLSTFQRRLQKKQYV
jgi:hypothetical protein